MREIKFRAWDKETEKMFGMNQQYGSRGKRDSKRYAERRGSSQDAAHAIRLQPL